MRRGGRGGTRETPPPALPQAQAALDLFSNSGHWGSVEDIPQKG